MTTRKKERSWQAKPILNRCPGGFSLLRNNSWRYSAPLKRQVTPKQSSSRRFGRSIDRILNEMLDFTALLEMGWHLGREEDFNDPFIPDSEPPDEEDDMEQAFCDRNARTGGGTPLLLHGGH